MGNCDSSCIAKVGTSRSSTKGTHVRGGRGGVRHKRIKSEHKHQGPIYWKFHENTSALEYYEPIRSIGEGSIGSIHLVRRRPERIDVPYQECLEIIIDGDSTDHPECSSTSSSEDGTDGPESEKETSQDQEELFVLKSILKDHLQDDDCLNEMRSEIHNMKYLDHPHIAKVYEAFEKKRMVWMVMENLSGGDLRSRMPYTEAEVADAIRDVLSAVVYLHSKNVVHRDLKLENIMFEDDSPTATASVKLIDFGLSTKYLSNEYKYMRERVGTVYTMSPQVVQGRYDKSCDLWSVGVITYILLSGGELPFPGKNRAQIVKMIMQCKFSFHGKQWSNVSKEAKDFITSLLQMDPLDRPRADAALKSNWMKKQFPPGAPNPKLQPSDRLDARQRIHEYGKETKLKRLALLFLAHKSTTSEIAKMRELFEEVSVCYRELECSLQFII